MDDYNITKQGLSRCIPGRMATWSAPPAEPLKVPPWGPAELPTPLGEQLQAISAQGVGYLYDSPTIHAVNLR